MKNRLLSTLERIIADLRDAIDAVVRDDYDEAVGHFESARDRLTAKAAELSPDNAKDHPDSPQERPDGPDTKGL